MAEPRLLLDHIAIAVPRLEEALPTLEKIFCSPASSPEVVATEKVRLSFLQVGDVRLEVLEGTAPDSPISRFLAGGRTGVHHLSFRLEGVDLDEWRGELERRGVQVVGSGVRPGAEGTRVLFIHPRSTAGILVEFSQKDEVGR